MADLKQNMEEQNGTTLDAKRDEKNETIRKKAFRVSLVDFPSHKERLNFLQFLALYYFALLGVTS